MLVWFRENRGRVVHFFVWPLIVVFIALYGSSQMAQQTNMNQLTAVKVNGQRVPRSEYLAVSDEVRRYYTGALIQPEKPQTQVALERVIEQALAGQLADELGLETSRDAVNQFITQQMTGPTGFFNEEGYLYFLRESGYETHENYRNVIQKQLDLRLALDYVRAAAVPSEEDIQRALVAQSEGRTAEMLAFPCEAYFDQVETTTDELKSYFEAHRERYRFPERMSLDYVAARPSEYVGEATPTAEDLERWFRSARDQFLIPPERDSSVHVFNQDAFTSKVTFTEEELKAQFDETADRYTEPERFKARFIVASVEVPDASIEKKMDENPENFLSEKRAVATRHILIRTTPQDDEETLAAKKAKIDEIRSRIQTLDDFVREAAAQSEDTSNAARGGDLGFTMEGRLVPEFESMAFSMEQNVVSEPVKTQFGYHLIWKYDEREAGKRISAAEARLRVLPEIDAAPIKDAARSRLTQAVAGVAEGAIAQATEVGGLTVYETDWFARGDSPHPEAARDRYPFYQAISKIAPGQRTEVIEGFASFFIAELVAKQDSRQLTFEEVRDKVEVALRAKKASELARKSAQEAGDLIRSGSMDYSEIPARYGLPEPTVHKNLRNPSGEQRPENRLVDREIINRTFTAEVGAVEGPFDTLAGPALLKVLEEYDERLPDLEDVRAEVEQAYRAEQAERLAREKVLDVWYDLELHDDDLTATAKEFDLPVQTTDFFQPGEPVPGFTSNSVVRYAAVGLRIVGATSTLLEDPISTPEAETPKEAFYLLQAKAIEKTRLPEFEEVIDQVRADLQLEKASALALADAQRARELLVAELDKASGPVSASRSIDLESFAKQHGFTFNGGVSVPLGTQVPTIPGQNSGGVIARSVYALPLGGITEIAPAVETVPEGDKVADRIHGYYIAQLVGIEDRKTLAPSRGQVFLSLAQRLRDAAQADWSERARKAAEIEFPSADLFSEDIVRRMTEEEDPS